MSKFVDNRDGWVSSDNRLQVHLFERDAPIFNPAQRYTFQIADHRFRIFASMGLHGRNNDVRSLLFEQVGVFQHLISLTDTGSCADVDT